MSDESIAGVKDITTDPPPFAETDDGPENSTEGEVREKTDDEYFRMFVGPNSNTFFAVFCGYREGKSKPSQNWVAFVAPIIWLFYRKLYLAGFASMAVPVVVGIIYPDIPDPAYIGLGIVFLFYSNQVYVMVADRRIRNLKALGLPQDEFENRLKRAGGTSPIAAIFGAVLMMALIALVVME